MPEIADEQAKVAKAYIAQLDDAHAYKAKVVTTIETANAPNKSGGRSTDARSTA